jgi:hypothetical protein
MSEAELELAAEKIETLETIKEFDLVKGPRDTKVSLDQTVGPRKEKEAQEDEGSAE